MLLGAPLWLVLAAVAGAGDLIHGSPLELKTGDRVVLVGSALIERDAESGYLETRVARRYPGQTIVWRNLGWSGDTVEGITRGKPNPPTDGFNKLVEHVAALQPTILILGYGANEAFGGAAGLPAFSAGLDRLWNELGKTGAKIVVLTPTRQEKLDPPLPDPTAHNADLQLYRDLLWSEATRRGAIGVDLFHALPTDNPFDPGPWTANGIHLTPAGYWMASAAIAPALTGPPVVHPVVTIEKGQATVKGATVTDFTATPTGYRFQVKLARLPDPPCPTRACAGSMGTAGASQGIRALDLAPGLYELRVDGQMAAGGTASIWRVGTTLILINPDVRQVEALRAAINRKNLLYFHRWRPQNETYLFGFRKHEQGKNAAELAAFDPLIAEAEAEIARLSVPVPHTYELIRVGDESKVTP